MKRIFTLLTLIVLVINYSFGQNAQKTLIKSLKLNGNTTIILDLDGAIEVKQWDNETMLRVQMDISLENSSNNVLKALMTRGRYNIRPKKTADGLELSTPLRRKDTKISGRTLNEVITYTIYIPEYIEVKRLDGVASSIMLIDNTDKAR